MGTTSFYRLFVPELQSSRQSSWSLSFHRTANKILMPGITYSVELFQVSSLHVHCESSLTPRPICSLIAWVRILGALPYPPTSFVHYNRRTRTTTVLMLRLASLYKKANRRTSSTSFSTQMAGGISPVCSLWGGKGLFYLPGLALSG